MTTNVEKARKRAAFLEGKLRNKEKLGGRELYVLAFEAARLKEKMRFKRPY